MFWKQLIFIFSCYFLVHSIALLYRLFIVQKLSLQVSPIIILLLSSVLIINFDYIYYYLEWHKQFPLLINAWVPIWFLISPLFYHLIKHELLGYSLKWYEGTHYVLFLYILYLVAPAYTWPAELKLETYLALTAGDAFEFSIVHLYLVLQITIYAMLIIAFTYRHIRKMKVIDSNTINIDLRLIYLLISIFLLYAALMGIIVFIFPDANLFRYLNGMDSLTLSLGVLILCNWMVKNRAKVTNQKKLNQSDLDVNTYSTSGLTKDELVHIIQQLQTTVGEQALFKNRNLKLSDVAEITNIKSHHISQALNQHLKKSFFDFINDFRIEAMKKALEDGSELKSYSLTGLAKEYGFNSNSSFYRIFKDRTGTTPGAYAKQMKQGVIKE